MISIFPPNFKEKYEAALQCSSCLGWANCLQVSGRASHKRLLWGRCAGWRWSRSHFAVYRHCPLSAGSPHWCDSVGRYTTAPPSPGSSSSFSFAGGGVGGGAVGGRACPCGCWPPWLMAQASAGHPVQGQPVGPATWVSLSPWTPACPCSPLFTSTLPPNCLLQGHKAPALEAKTAALQGVLS